MSAKDEIKRIDAALEALRSDKSITDERANWEYRSLQSQRKSAVAVRARERELEDRYKPHRYIVKCKGCGGAATSALLTLDRETERWPNRYDRWVDEYGVRYITTQNDYRPIIPCRKCGQRYFGKEVRGVYNPDIVCNAKCQAAKGPNCECSCGGEQHGKAWGG
jgi:hypothetical protein